MCRCIRKTVYQRYYDQFLFNFDLVFWNCCCCNDYHKKYCNGIKTMKCKDIKNSCENSKRFHTDEIATNIQQSSFCCRSNFDLLHWFMPSWNTITLFFTRTWAWAGVRHFSFPADRIICNPQSTNREWALAMDEKCYYAFSSFQCGYCFSAISISSQSPTR